MATIYTKPTTVGNENCIILDYRQGLRYPFNIGDWNRIRCSMVWSYTAGNNNDNMDGFGPALVTPNNVEDRFFFGLKKYSLKFPQADDSEYFLGLSNSGVSSFINFPVSAFGTGTEHGTIMNLGVRHPNETFSGTTLSYSQCEVYQFDDTSNFAAIICFDLTLINKGLSNQKINLKYAKQSITDTSKSNIESIMGSASYTDYGDLDFNYNGVAYDSPNSFFIYTPYGNIRTRLFSLDVIHVS